MKSIFVVAVLILTVNAELTKYNLEKLQANGDVEALVELLGEVLQDVASKMPQTPDSDLTVAEFLEKYGYPFEEYNVTTEDKYILTLHRIPHGRNVTDLTNDTKPRPVVFLQHCLMCSSMIYMIRGPEKSLGLILADAGYDVWLANSRGNRYTFHENLTEKDDAYWDFSFHERAVHDIPTSIDFVLESTEVKKLTYVGFSEGTTEGLIFASIKPEYNDKLNLMVLLSPVGYMSNLTSPIPRMLADYMDPLILVANIMDIKSIPYSPIFGILGEIFCNDQSSLQPICSIILQLIVGFDPAQLNTTELPLWLSVMPAGASLKEFIHYGQEMKSGYFRQYDYGAIENVFRYRNVDPPSYDVSQITCPVAAYYGQNDFMAAIVDVERLLDQIPNIVVQKLLDYEQFSHFDFVTAIDVKTLLYDDVLHQIKQYNPVN